MSLPTCWVPFSERYGYRSHLDAWGGDSFWCRHSHTVDDDDGKWGNCKSDPRLRCACPGNAQPNPWNISACCGRATQEDRLCDACRKWCYAVDDQNTHYRLIDIHGAAS